MVFLYFRLVSDKHQCQITPPISILLEILHFLVFDSYWSCSKVRLSHPFQLFFRNIFLSVRLILPRFNVRVPLHCSNLLLVFNVCHSSSHNFTHQKLPIIRKLKPTYNLEFWIKCLYFTLFKVVYAFPHPLDLVHQKLPILFNPLTTCKLKPNYNPLFKTC